MIDFDLTEEQKMLRDSARRFFESRHSALTARQLLQNTAGYSSELWQEMANMGWLGITIPQKYSGAEGTLLDQCILCEEIGRACLIDPYIQTAVLGTQLILEGSDADQRERMLPAITTGKVILSVALTEPSTKYEPYSMKTTAIENDGTYIASGTKLFVEYAHIADYVILVSRVRQRGRTRGADQLGLFLIENDSSDIDCTLLKIFGGDKQCEIIFNNVVIPTENVLGTFETTRERLDQAITKAIIAKCFEMLGNTEKIVDMSVEYAKTRKQFSRPIGSFQSMQWLCADMSIESKAAKYMIYRTAWELYSGNLASETKVAMCKAWISDAQYRICFRAHEIFGAIGFTEDHDLSLYTRRAKSQELAFGDARYHRQVIAAKLSL